MPPTTVLGWLIFLLCVLLWVEVGQRFVAGVERSAGRKTQLLVTVFIVVFWPAFLLASLVWVIAKEPRAWKGNPPDS